MGPRIFLWSLTSALAGFLFGFDTVVISGAEQTIQTCGASARPCTASRWAPRFRAQCSARCSAAGRRIGSAGSRRCSGSACSILVGSVWSAYREGSVIVHRSPGSSAELPSASPPWPRRSTSRRSRRRNVSRAPRGHVPVQHRLRHLVAFLSNFLLEGIGDNAWRWMLGVMAVPSLIYTACVFADSGKSALALSTEGRPRRRNGRAATHQPEAASTTRDRGRRLDDIADAAAHHEQGRRMASGRATARAHPARLPRRVLQSTLRHQRHPLLRAAHLRTDRARRKGRAAAIRRHRHHESRLHLRRPVAHRPAGPAHAALHRFVRLHRVARPLRVGVLHRAFRHRARVHLRFHRRARHRPGRGHLGVHLGNLSRTNIAPKASRSAASRTGFSPRCSRRSFPRWSRPFRPATSSCSSAA